MSSADRASAESLSDRFEAYLMRHHLSVRAIAPRGQPPPALYRRVGAVHARAAAVSERGIGATDDVDWGFRRSCASGAGTTNDGDRRENRLRNGTRRGRGRDKDDDEEERMREKMTEFMRRHRVKQTVRVRVDLNGFAARFRVEHFGRLRTNRRAVVT